MIENCIKQLHGAEQFTKSVGTDSDLIGLCSKGLQPPASS